MTYFNKQINLKQIMVLTGHLGDHKDHISIGFVRTIICRVSCNIAHGLRVDMFGSSGLAQFVWLCFVNGRLWLSL